MPLPEPDRKTCHDCSSRHQCLIGRQSDAARAPWAAMVEERRFRKGDVLQHQGETAGAVAVIKVGTALLQRAGADQVARPVAMAGCGQALGTSAVLGTPEDLTWVAVMEGRLCEVPASALLRAGGGGTEFLQSLLREEVQARARLADWSGLLRLRGVTAQLASALLQLSQLQRSTLVRLPTHTVLASLLATTRETVARSLTQLALHGAVVRHDRWHCAIVRGPLIALLEGRAVKVPAVPPETTAAPVAVPALAPVSAPLRRPVALREVGIPIARPSARTAAAPTNATAPRAAQA